MILGLKEELQSLQRSLKDTTLTLLPFKKQELKARAKYEKANIRSTGLEKPKADEMQELPLLLKTILHPDYPNYQQGSQKES